MEMKRLNISSVLFLFAVLCCTFFGSVTTSADVLTEGSSTLILKSEKFKSDKTITVPDWQAQREAAEAEERRMEAEARMARGQAYAGNYSDSTTYSGSGSSVASYAQQFLGKPYVWGAEGPNAFDCSGFTLHVYRNFGIYLPHYTGSQVQMGRAVSRNDLREGDLVFFNTYESFGHVGIYIGGGNFIHASTGSRKVTISSLNSSYYSNNYAGARRLID